MSYISMASTWFARYSTFFFCERIYDEIGFDLCFGFRCFASGLDLFRL